MSEMAVEVLKQQLADLTRDYTGACEAIRQLEANVAAYRDKLDDLTEQRADLQQDRARLRAARDAALLNHTAALLEVGRMRDETIALREQLTAAEAAREAVAGEVRDACKRAVRETGARPMPKCCKCGMCVSIDDMMAHIARVSLPTPSAALQRVREQAVADFLARCEPKPSEESVKKIVASMFPTPDAGGPT